MSRRVLLAASALAGAALFLGPWMIRNGIRYRAFLPVNDAAGFNLYLGNSDWTVAFYRIQSRRDYDHWNRVYIEGFPGRWIREVPGVGDPNPARRNRALARAAWKWASAHPGAEARLLVSKLRDWLRPWPNPLVWQPLVVVLIGLYYAALFVLTGLGLSRAGRRGIAHAAIFVLGASTLAHVLLFVTWRYRSPFWDPVLILYSVAAFAPSSPDSAGAR